MAEQNQQLFKQLQDSCTATLAGLKRPRTASSSSSATSSSAPPPLADIRNDTLALLQLVSKEATNLSLALKPPVAQDAVKGTLEKLVDLAGKIRFVGEQLPTEGVLTKRISWTLQESLESLSHLLSTASTSLGTSSSPSSTAAEKKKARDTLLVATKSFWTFVERAERLPRDELEATRGSWKDVLGLLDDCLEEMKEMGQDEGEKDGEAEEGEQDEAEDDGSDEEDEEDEDDFGSSRAYNPKERARVSATHHLLRLTRLLINRLFTRTTPSSLMTLSTTLPSLATSLSAPAFLSSAQRLVQQLSALGDDVAAALEPPQRELAETVDELCEVADELASEMERAVEASSEAKGAGADQAGDDQEKAEEVRKGERDWLAMWRKQRDEARAKLAEI